MKTGFLNWNYTFFLVSGHSGGARGHHGAGGGGGGGRGYDYDPWGGNGNQFSRPPPTMQRGYYH